MQDVHGEDRRTVDDVVMIGVDPHKASVTRGPRHPGDPAGQRDLLDDDGRVPGHDADSCASGRGGCGPWRVPAVSGGPWSPGWSLAGSGSSTCRPGYRRDRRCSTPGKAARPTPHVAHAIAMVALRDKRLREVVIDEDRGVLRLL